jgi:hypothetical protein
MNTQRPPFFAAPPPQVETPAPLHLPAPSSAELLGRLGTVAALTMGGTVGLILLGLTASWGVGGLTLLLLVGDTLLWAGAVLASYPLRAAVQDYHLRRAALELELDERAAYLELGRALLRAWGRKSYGRQTRPAERVVWVRDGSAPVAPSNGRVNTSSAVRGETDASGHSERARVMLGDEPQTGETEPPAERITERLTGAQWSDAAVQIWERKQAGLSTSQRECQAAGVSRPRWEKAMGEFASFGFVEKGRDGGWVWLI